MAIRDYGIIIQCRDKSTRFPFKSVRPFWKGKSILEILVDRFRLLDYKTVVATSYNSPKTIQICERIGVSYHVAQEDNVAVRIWHTAKRYNLDGFFRVCADNPFIQISFLQTLSNFIDDGYEYIAFEDCMKRHEGFFAEYININALYRVLFFNDNRYDLEHVTPYIIRHPEKFKQKILLIPTTLYMFNIRLTVDTASDFCIAKKVYKYMKEEHWENIVEYIYDNPKIEEEMLKNIRENKK